MRVLVAEDTGVLRMIIVRTLSGLGVEHIVEASDGAQAWQCFQADEFDLVISDWHMPRINGIDLVKLIRRSNTEVPVMMVTVEDSRDQVMKALAAGATDYLCKPFERSELEAKVERNLPALKIH
ncbi:MAG TPA: two-component system response regulator [Planctomycetaceae bacterium]|nr:two-component system response regulator [Planctomycetaceae bacterium]